MKISATMDLELADRLYSTNDGAAVNNKYNNYKLTYN